MKLKLLALFLLCSSLAFGVARTASVTGDWSSTSTWGGSSVPGDGDTCTINTAVTVTVSDARTIGTDGATGTVACTIAGTTGALTVASGGNLTLHGDLSFQLGTTFTLAAGSTLTFDPITGSTYRVTLISASSGSPHWTTTGSAGSHVTVTTTARGGGNGWFRTGGAGSVIYSFAYTDFTKCGDGTNNCTQFTTSVTGSTNSFSHVSFLTSGVVETDASEGTVHIDVDGMDLRDCQNSICYQFLGTSTISGGGSRTLKNVTIYNAAVKQIKLNAAGTKCGLSIAAGDGTDTPCIVGYFAKTAGGLCVGCTFSDFIFIQPTGTVVSFLSPATISTEIYQDGIFLSSGANPHQITESAGGSASANIYRRIVCDNNTFAGDGDFLQALGPATMDHNILIGNCGSQITLSSLSTGPYTMLNNTFYQTDGAALCESGCAGVARTGLAAYRNNLIVFPLNGQGNGVHQVTAFLRQTNITSTLWDYNFFWQMPGSGDAGANGALAAPGNLLKGTDISYVQFPAIAVVNLAGKLASATVDDTHLTCSTCDFVTNAVIAGDYLIRISDKSYARVSSVTDATHLVLISPGITGLASGNTVDVRNSYSSVAGDVYGTAWGSHDSHTNPQFVAPTRTLTTWDVSLGGAGTLANIGAQMVKLNGTDSAGATASFDGTHTVIAALTYIRGGFTPGNAALNGAGSPTDSSPDIGAVGPSVVVGGTGGVIIE